MQESANTIDFNYLERTVSEITSMNELQENSKKESH